MGTEAAAQSGHTYFQWKAELDDEESKLCELAAEKKRYEIGAYGERYELPADETWNRAWDWQELQGKNLQRSWKLCNRSMVVFYDQKLVWTLVDRSKTPPGEVRRRVFRFNLQSSCLISIPLPAPTVYYGARAVQQPSSHSNPSTRLRRSDTQLILSEDIREALYDVQ